MQPKLYWLWQNAGGAGKLTAKYVARLTGIMCPGCKLMRAPFPMEIEVSADEHRDYAGRLIEMVLAANPPLKGLDVPLNWVSTIDAGVMRQDLLEIVRPVTPMRWRYGVLSVHGQGIVPGFTTVHDPAPLTLRGSKSMRSACRECGAFGYIPAGRFYVLAKEMTEDQICGLRYSSQFAVTEGVAEAIRARFLGRRRDLRISPLAVRTKPNDGLPLVLPRTWEEYEEWERSQGREPVFPKRRWPPEPEEPVGRWDRQRIERLGLESVFERPTAASIRRLLPSPQMWAIIKQGHKEVESLMREREAWLREMLKQWPKEVRDEVLKELDRQERP